VEGGLGVETQVQGYGDDVWKKLCSVELRGRVDDMGIEVV